MAKNYHLLLPQKIHKKQKLTKKNPKKTPTNKKQTTNRNLPIWALSEIISLFSQPSSPLKAKWNSLNYVLYSIFVFWCIKYKYFSCLVFSQSILRLSNHIAEQKKK